MRAGVSAYQVDYFVPIAREVLDRPLAEHGFDYDGDYRALSVYWSRGSVFVRVGYLAETMPDYELLLGVGWSDGSPIAPKSSGNSIGVWRLLPEDEVERIARWRFDGPDRLRHELQRAWREALLPHALPVLEDEESLVRTIALYNDELTQQDEETMTDRLLRFAREKFKEGLFSEARQAYDELPADRLSRADAMRAELARRRS